VNWTGSGQLTRKEFELLRLLMTNAGQTVPRRVLIERVWAGVDRGRRSTPTSAHPGQIEATLELGLDLTVRKVATATTAEALTAGERAAVFW